MSKERTLKNQQNGKLGGLTTAKRYGKEFTVARAETAGTATLRKFGRDYYASIRKLRNKFPHKYKKGTDTEQNG